MQALAYVIEVDDVMASWYRNLKAMPVTAFSFCAFPGLPSGFLRQRLSFWYLRNFFLVSRQDWELIKIL